MSIVIRKTIIVVATLAAGLGVAATAMAQNQSQSSTGVQGVVAAKKANHLNANPEALQQLRKTNQTSQRAAAEAKMHLDEPAKYHSSIGFDTPHSSAQGSKPKSGGN